MQQHGQKTSWAPEGEMPTTAHLRAGQIWDARIGEARVQAFNWRRMTFFMGAITMVSVLGLIAQSFKQDVVPYLVEVEASGKVRLVGSVTEQDWSLNESAKLHQLESWITNLRGLSSDAAIMEDRLAYVRHHATAAGNVQLGDYMERENPLEKFGEETRTIHVESTTKVAGSEQAYRVEWLEKVFSHGGKDQGVERYVGEFHLSITPPTTREELQMNPLGVYITFFDFSEKR